MWTLVLKNLPGIALAAAVITVGWYIGNYIAEHDRLIQAEKDLTTEVNAVKASYSTEQENHRKTKSNFKQYQTDMVASVNDMVADIEQVNNDFMESEERVNELSKKLGRHNLSFLAASKPGLISRRSTEATKKLFDALNELTNGKTKRTNLP